MVLGWCQYLKQQQDNCSSLDTELVFLVHSQSHGFPVSTNAAKLLVLFFHPNIIHHYAQCLKFEQMKTKLILNVWFLTTNYSNIIAMVNGNVMGNGGMSNRESHCFERETSKTNTRFLGVGGGGAR